MISIKSTMPGRKPKPDHLPSHRMTAPDKLCKTCGRAISWRKKWEKDWDAIQYCSDACRTHKPGDTGQALETAILTLLAERGRVGGNAKTICPSEAAKLVGGDATRRDWESLMDPARAAARRLVAQGRILITQKGHAVDPSTAKGPIRLRLR